MIRLTRSNWRLLTVEEPRVEIFLDRATGVRDFACWQVATPAKRATRSSRWSQCLCESTTFRAVPDGNLAECHVWTVANPRRHSPSGRSGPDVWHSPPVSRTARPWEIATRSDIACRKISILMMNLGGKPILERVGKACSSFAEDCHKGHARVYAGPSFGRLLWLSSVVCPGWCLV